MAHPITPGTFFLESNNKEWLQGEREYPVFSDHTGTLIMTVLLIVFGAGFTIMNFMQWTEQNRIYNSGVMAQGLVESRREAHDSENNSTRYYIAYSFDANGVSYSREVSVNQELYNRAEYGSKINVYYLPDNPTLSTIDNEGQSAIMIGVGALLTGIAIFLFVMGLRSISDEHRLYDNGKLIAGEVVHARGYTDSDGDYQLTVKYRFRSPDSGEIRTGKRSGTRDTKDKNFLPQEGDPVMVMYLDDKSIACCSDAGIQEMPIMG